MKSAGRNIEKSPFYRTGTVVGYKQKIKPERGFVMTLFFILLLPLMILAALVRKK